MAADLHLHTTASDGLLPPQELVRRAAEEGLQIIAITDHDSTEGLPEAAEAARAFPALTLIPGVELSTDAGEEEVHILGYFNALPGADFQKRIAAFREARVGRARRMVEKLEELGMPVEWERVQQLAREGSIGRPHIALALQERGYVSTVAEAFDLYIGRTGPAYADRFKLTPPEAIGLIQEAGGLAVFAHPLNKDTDIGNANIAELTLMVRELEAAGLTGMECHYGAYTPETVAYLASVAEANGLLALGGSDYHGPGIGAQVGLGAAHVPLEAGEALLERLRQAGVNPSP